MSSNTKRRRSTPAHAAAPDPQRRAAARDAGAGLSLSGETNTGSTKGAEQPADAVPPRWFSARWRAIISLAILFHLAAVFAAALRIPPTSQLALGAAWSVHWYTNAVLVNPGYRFFAPDPGLSADMMRVVIVPAEGPPREETYPNLNQEWPRLLYHRHFMLTSRLAGNPAEPMTQALANSYARHIAAREGAGEVRVFRLAHRIPTPDQVLNGTSLRAEPLYRTEFNSPAGVWTYIAAGSFDRTRLELRLALDGDASLSGEILGKAVRSQWRWQQGPPSGPPQVGFVAPGKQFTSGEPDWTADWPEPNDLVLHYPLSGARVGVSRETIEHIPLRRGETPPLAVYREEER